MTVSCDNCVNAYKINGMTYCRTNGFEWHIGQVEYTARVCVNYKPKDINIRQLEKVDAEWVMSSHMEET